MVKASRAASVVEGAFDKQKTSIPPIPFILLSYTLIGMKDQTIASVSPSWNSKSILQNALVIWFKMKVRHYSAKVQNAWIAKVLFLFLFSTLVTDNLAQTVTVFSTSAAPSASLKNDGKAVQLGMKFQSSVDGFVTGARFYKQSGNNGTHTGQLYTKNGTLLASAIFVNETESGWQVVAFASPVAVTASTTYMISYHSSEGYYSADDYGFNQPIINEPLRGLAHGEDGPNGMYRYTSTPAIPNRNFRSSNYFVDVVFAPNGIPSNQLPTVSITSPADNASFTEPAEITIVAAASDIDGTVSKVEFFQGGIKLGEDIDGSNGWSYFWGSVTAGTYQLTAKATDELGAEATSALVNVSVNSLSNQAPAVSITSPADNASFTEPAEITIVAAASDIDGTVSKVEFFQGGIKLGEDIDGSNGWSYFWGSVAAGTYQLTAKATDELGAEATSAAVHVTIDSAQGEFSCPCTIFQPTDAPTNKLWSDGVPLQLGMKFRSRINGYISGVRFYKQSGNLGTHTGQLYSRNGSLMASTTFYNETASGWQQVNFATPVPITENTTYIISYHSSAGYYSSSNPFFSQNITNGPLTALENGVDGGNGVYIYSSTTAFPNKNYQSSNYWVDVVFTTEIGPDNTPPAVVSTSPVENAVNVNESTNVEITFSEDIDPSTISDNTIQLWNGSSPVTASITYDPGTFTATLNPAVNLSYATTYTARVKGGDTDPSIKDLIGNALAADFEWSFTIRATPPQAPPPLPPINDGPGGPIIVISSTNNPFSRYPVEILRAEGLNYFAAKDISEVNSSLLSNYEVVLLGEFPLTDSHVGMFTDWVNAGGTLIAFKPAPNLASLMGITKTEGTLTDQYLLVNTQSGPGVGIVDQTIQFQGTADLYALNGAISLATLYSNANTATLNPAVTWNNVGTNGGKAIAFTYDLGRSIVYTRQGNPLWAGQKRDGTSGPIRPDDMFYPDWVDLNKVAIPQADEQQRLLANIILQANIHRKPLPRFWYFPRGLKAAVIMTGDDHSNGGTVGRFNQYLSLSPSNAAHAVANWTAIRGTSYIYPGTKITDAQATDFEAQGFEIGLHLNTNCANWTADSWRDFFNAQSQQLAGQLPGIAATSTHRTHCIAWSDWVNQAKVQAENGIRLDVNYYYWPGKWVEDRPGMFTGSGMPMRFADTDGTLIDCYQAPTQITDESGQTYSMHINTLLDNALGPAGYYGAFCANMHTDLVSSTGSDAIIASALEREIPVISAKQMLTWLDGRNASSFGTITWNENIMSFSITAAYGSHDLRAMLPLVVEAGPLSALTQDGSSVSFTTETIKGIEYAFFSANSGNYEAVYGLLANARLKSETKIESGQPPSNGKEENGNGEFFIQIYPNPSSGEELQVEAQGLTSGEEVAFILYNPLGGVETSVVDRADDWGNFVKRMDLPNELSTGIYILTLQSETRIIRQKIIVLK